MAEIAKILRTFEPGGKYWKTFPKSIAFSPNLSNFTQKSLSNTTRFISKSFFFPMSSLIPKIDPYLMYLLFTCQI